MVCKEEAQREAALRMIRNEEGTLQMYIEGVKV